MTAERKPSRAASGDSAAFQRRARPVRVRRGVLDWRSWPWKRIGLTVAATAASLGSLHALDGYVRTAERFQFPADGSGLAVSGLNRLTPEAVRQAFEADFGRSIAGIPLEERRQMLEETAWVKTAAVCRIWPSRIWVDLVEREPVAWVRIQGEGALEQALIDREGAVLEPLPRHSFELPVVDGIERAMTAADRVSRVALVERLIASLDAEEPRYSSRISQIDVADAANAKAVTLHDGDVIQLQFGDELFRHRFEVFLRYIDSWKRQFGAVEWVDLRFEGQAVVQPLDRARGAKPRRQSF